ncbi:hypothetical protein JR338_02705 [Chloroflexota bacterium]|nr:hypothetical protein JR338_02705 [Chloroflexota bacterium]
MWTPQSVTLAKTAGQNRTLITEGDSGAPTGPVGRSACRSGRIFHTHDFPALTCPEIAASQRRVYSFPSSRWVVIFDL